MCDPNRCPQAFESQAWQGTEPATQSLKDWDPPGRVMVLNIPKLQRPFEGPHFSGRRETQQEAGVTRRTTHPPLLDRKASLSNQGLGWGSRYKGEFWMGRKKLVSIFMNCTHIQIKRRLRPRPLISLGFIEKHDFIGAMSKAQVKIMEYKMLSAIIPRDICARGWYMEFR